MKKKHFKIFGWLVLAVLLAIVLCNFTISNAAGGKTFSNVDEVVKNKVGLVLGTAKKDSWRPTQSILQP